MTPSKLGQRLSIGWMLAIYAFLYLPSASLIAYSFNDSKMVTLWSGFTLHWYGDVFRDRDLMEALGLSLRIVYSI
jgi:putrescine transport system permease protein